MGDFPDSNPVPAQAAAASGAEASFQRDYFDEFVSIMGSQRAVQWIERLNAQLETATFADDSDQDELRVTAHSFVAQAGTLGFSEFSNLCTELETALALDQPYSAQLDAVRREAQQIAPILQRLKSELSGR